MGKKLIQKPVWEFSCDWCEYSVDSRDGTLPNGWFDADTVSGEDYGGTVFCSDKCSTCSYQIWEESFDVGFNARVDYYMKCRTDSLKHNNDQ